MPWQHYKVIINGAVDSAASLTKLKTDVKTLHPEWFTDCRYGQLAKFKNYFATLYNCNISTIFFKGEFNKFCAAVKRFPDRLAFLGVEPSQPDGSNNDIWSFAAAYKAFIKRFPYTPHALPGVILNEAGWNWLYGWHILCEQGVVTRLGLGRGDCWQVDMFPSSGQHLADEVGKFNLWKKNAGQNVPTIIREVAYGTGQQYPTMESDLKNREILEQADKLVASGDILAYGWATSRWHAYPGPASDLLTENGELTPLGKAFA